MTYGCRDCGAGLPLIAEGRCAYCTELRELEAEARAVRLERRKEARFAYVMRVAEKVASI